MTLTTSIRAAVMAAVLASAGFGQSQTPSQQETGMTQVLTTCTLGSEGLLSGCRLTE